jgi:hypothetical protein
VFSMLLTPLPRRDMHANAYMRPVDERGTSAYKQSEDMLHEDSPGR